MNGFKFTRFLPHLSFALSPWLLAVGLTWVVTILGLIYLLLVSRRNAKLIVTCCVVAAGFFVISPYSLGSTQIMLSALLVSLHVSLIVAGPFLRMNIEPARNTWVLHLSYGLFFLLFFATGDLLPKAAMQISLFPYLSYVSLYGRAFKVFLKDLWMLALLVLGSARSILGGFIVGRLLGSIPAAFTRPIFYAGLILVASGSIIFREDLINVLTLGYEALKAAGYLLKGRTIFALALLKNTESIELLGAGAGYTMSVMTSSFDSHANLHNDVLRTLFDYGLIALLLVMTVLVRHLFLATKGFVVVAMFLAFMLTGNVLSYSTVVIPLLFALSREIKETEEEHQLEHGVRDA